MKRNLLTLLMMILPLFAVAQGNGGGGDPDTPIDGGLSILLAAGAAYGAKRIASNRKENKDPEHPGF